MFLSFSMDNCISSVVMFLCVLSVFLCSVCFCLLFLSFQCLTTVDDIEYRAAHAQ